MSAVFKRAYDRFCKQYEMAADSQAMRVLAGYHAILVISTLRPHT